MHISRDNVDVKMEAPGAILRMRTDFGEAGSLGTMSGEVFSLAAGVDTAPLFEGLDGNMCQCPHWGYVIRGRLTTTDARGRKETVVANDLFHWPPGHNVRVEEDADIVMFSPQEEHAPVVEHMRSMLQQPARA